MCGAVTSTLVAREFVKLADTRDPELTQLKLMKLTFFAHGWHLGIHGNPLICEDARAWPHGPVFKDLYHATKHYDRGVILDVPMSKRERSFEKAGINKIEKKGRKIIKRVSDAYKENTAWQLRELSHREGSPWETTFILHHGIDGEPVIENILIEKYYAGQIGK